MSLSATMWTSVSGLLGHGKKMNTIGNNIANINTVGFKGQRMDFADFVYQDTNSLAGPTQNGFGVQVGAIMGNFSQGAFETTQESTDLAINGKGFFQVQPVGSDEAYYTRAGNFRFDSEGYLKDPNGFALQGWKIDNSGGVQQAAGGSPTLGTTGQSTSPILGAGVPTDVKLDTFTVFPQQTTKMDFQVNLPKDGADNAKNTENPFAALFNVWDGTQPPKTANTPAIAQTSFAEQTSISIYDEAGVKHTATVYFDKVSKDEYEGGNSGDEVWEYIVTIDPSEDKRQFVEKDPITGVETLKNVNETKAGGMLMSGTLHFNSSGALTNQSAYTWGGAQNPEDNPGSFSDVADPAGGLDDKEVINLDPTDMDNWEPAAISQSGYPIVVANFGGILDAQTTGTANGSKYNTEINFGIKAGNLSSPWENNGSLAAMNSAAYIFNTAYKPNDDTTGPEHILLNPDYNPDLDDKWNPTTNRYEMGGVSQWTFETEGTDLFTLMQLANQPVVPPTTPPTTFKAFEYKDGTPVTDADYQKMLELYDIDTVSIKAGAMGKDAAGALIPPSDAKVNLKDGTVTKSDGTPFDPANPLDTGGIDITTAAHALEISKAVSKAVDGGRPQNLNLLSAATPSNANDISTYNEPAIIEAGATTNLGGDFTSANSQDGYGFGNLTSWNFDSDGVLHGKYSNGVSLPLWQLTMYDFNSPQGLRREGNNLFTSTRESGEAKSGAAGTGGLGDVSGYSLEQSNVDMSTEFVYMITTQRGYQSNSKLITTTDQMLETVINMKR